MLLLSKSTGTLRTMILGSVVAIAPLLGLSALVTVVVSGVTTFALRAGSIAFGWSLPVYKSRPPRQ